MKSYRSLKSIVSTLISLSIIFGYTAVWASPTNEDEGDTPDTTDTIQTGDNEDYDPSDYDVSDQVESYGYDSIVAAVEAEEEYRDSVEYIENTVVFSVIQYRAVGDSAVYLTADDDICQEYLLTDVEFILETKTDKVIYVLSDVLFRSCYYG